MEKPKLCREVREYYFALDVKDYLVEKYGDPHSFSVVFDEFNEGNGRNQTVCENYVDAFDCEFQREAFMRLMDEFGEGEVGEREVILYYWW